MAKPPLPCLLPALKRGGVWGKPLLGNGEPLSCAGARALHGICTLGTAQGDCDALALPVSLPGIRVPDRNELLLFPEVQTWNKQKAPNENLEWRCRVQVWYPAFSPAPPTLCCVCGVTAPGSCTASGLPIPVLFLWDCPLGAPAAPQEPQASEPPHIPNEGRDQHSHTRMCLRDEALWNTQHPKTVEQNPQTVPSPCARLNDWHWEHSLVFFLFFSLFFLSRKPLGGN